MKFVDEEAIQGGEGTSSPNNSVKMNIKVVEVNFFLLYIYI